MRVTIIGYFSDASQNSVRILQALALQGHNMQGLDFKTFDICGKTLKHRSEFVLVTMGRDWDHSPAKELREKGVFLANWVPDEYGPSVAPGGLWFNKIRGIYHLLLVQVRGIVPLLKDYADEVIWVPMYFDQRYHGCAEKRGNFLHDLGFLGGPNQEQSSIRLKFLLKLIEDKYNLKVGGGQDFWRGQDRNLIPPEYFVGERALVGSEMAKFYSRAKIGLNFINDLLPQYDLGCSNRIFKVIGCGSLLLTHEIEGLDEYLTEGKHYVSYSPTDYYDLRAKVDFCLANARICEQIATAGRQHILENYSIDRITKLFIEEIQKRL